MRIALGSKAERLRKEVREWIARNRVEGLEDVDEWAGELGGGSSTLERRSREAREAYAEWTRRLREAGWLCVSWPREYGGRGLSSIELVVVNEEFTRAGVPRVTLGFGESLVGPAIIVHGTEAQKRYFLPRIISGEDTYCHGFSEPNAGSDLAGLQTRGIVEEDTITLEGEKVWTTNAHKANMMFALCRTDPDAPKHAGISYVLVPMKDNHIVVHPLRQMTGESGFNSVLLKGARAPLFNVIGGLNNGWRVAMTTLDNERGGGVTIQHLRFQRELEHLVQIVRRLGHNNDPTIRQELAWAYTQIQLMRYSGLRLLATMAAGEQPGPEASITKLFWSEYHKKFGEIATRVMGMAAVAGDEEATRWCQNTFLRTRAYTIGGGTSQIQRNIISERTLGLPKERKADTSRGNA